MRFDCCKTIESLKHNRQVLLSKYFKKVVGV